MEDGLHEARRRVLVISHDVVGKKMAGPGIRYYSLARVLSHYTSTVLAVPRESSGAEPVPGLAIEPFVRRNWATLAPLVEAAEVIVFPSDIANDFPQLAGCHAFLVVDGYDPLLAEWLALSPFEDSEGQAGRWWQRTFELGQQYLAGDFFLCASERQRSWWLGLLEANGRINPWTYGEDASLRRLVDVVAYGLPEGDPEHTRQVVKGVWPGIGRQDKVLLWGGGLWPWLDPITAIRAVARVHEHRQDVRLIFPGTRHPNPLMAPMPTQNAAAQAEAERLGIIDKAVFFGDWLPYADWPNVLLESDGALTLHHNTLETQLAYRSRVLDYVWAGLPTVATGGDATSELIVRYGLGEVVDYGDVEGVATAIERLLEAGRAPRRETFTEAHRALTWECAARPLVEFCMHPRRAPDKAWVGPQMRAAALAEERERLRAETDYWQDLAHRYERGRFMRLMHWCRHTRLKLTGGRL